MPNLVLTYFDSAGRAEPVRVALRLGGVPFEDRRLKFPEFQAARAAGAFPIGAVPVLEVDGMKIVQTAAMLRYAARLGDRSLYPDDPWSALLVDSVVDSMNDTLSHALLPSLFERDMEKKLAMRAELATGRMAQVCQYVEGILERSGGPFVAGRTLTVADLVVAAQVLNILKGGLDGIAPSYLDAYPRLKGVAEAYLADPRIQGLAKA